MIVSWVPQVTFFASGNPAKGTISRVKARLAAVLLLLLATPSIGGEIRGTCETRFLGSSTLHDFKGTGSCRPFSARLVRDAAGKSVLPSVAVEVPVAGMKTGNDSRDGKMREMFQSDRFPAILATARDIDIDGLRERVRKGREGKTPLEIVLAIRGVERKLQATVGGLKEEGSRVSFDIEFPVSLNDFGLKPPSVLGIIRVADKVVVGGTFALDVSSSP